jgi:hypothetical protein
VLAEQHDGSSEAVEHLRAENIAKAANMPVAQEKSIWQTAWDWITAPFDAATASAAVTSGKGRGLAALVNQTSPDSPNQTSSIWRFLREYDGKDSLAYLPNTPLPDPAAPTATPTLPKITPIILPEPTIIPMSTMLPSSTPVEYIDPVKSGVFKGLGKTFSGDDMKNLCEYLAGIDYLDSSKTIPAPWKTPGSNFGPTECMAWYIFKETKAVYPLDLPLKYYYDTTTSKIDAKKIWQLEDINALKDSAFYYLAKAATSKLWSLHTLYAEGYPDLTPMSEYNMIGGRESAMRDVILMRSGEGELEKYYLLTGEGTSYYPVAQYITQIMLNPPDKTWKKGWWDWGNIYVFENPATYDAILASPTLNEDQAASNKISKLFCSYLPDDPTPEQKEKTFCIFTGDQLTHWKTFDNNGVKK